MNKTTPAEHSTDVHQKFRMELPSNFSSTTGMCPEEIQFIATIFALP